MHGIVQCFSNDKVHTNQLPGDLVKMHFLIQKVWGQTKILPRFLTGSQVKLMLWSSNRTLNSKGWNKYMITNKNLVSIEEALNIVRHYIKYLILNPCLLLISVAWKALEMQILCPGQRRHKSSMHQAWESERFGLLIPNWLLIQCITLASYLIFPCFTLLRLDY